MRQIIKSVLVAISVIYIAVLIIFVGERVGFLGTGYLFTGKHGIVPTGDIEWWIFIGLLPLLFVVGSFWGWLHSNKEKEEVNDLLKKYGKKDQSDNT